MEWKAHRSVEIAPVHLPEFDLEVSWAMCRNPMCKNFGVFFRGSITEGKKAAKSDEYFVRIKSVKDGRLVGEIECRYCGNTAQLHANRSIRTIARYFLSLSLPFKDCPNPGCRNQGVNIFEHWVPTGQGRARHYSKNGREGKQAKCLHCEAALKSGEDRPFAPYLDLCEPLGTGGNNRVRRRIWERIIEGVRTKRKVSDTYEVVTNLGVGNYYRYLDHIGPRLQEFQSARNMRLLHPNIKNRNEPIRLFTDVLDVSLKAYEKEKTNVTLHFILTTTVAKRTIFIVAIHPFFLPKEFCPSDEQRDEDDPAFRLSFEREWQSLLHPGSAREASSSGKKLLAKFPELGRGGFFINGPYAQLAHFLVVQKMLARFRTLHCHMDAFKPLFTGATIAMRERILAGRPDTDAVVDGRRLPPKTAEIVVCQHEKKTRARQGRMEFPEEDYEELKIKDREQRLKKAWDAAEARLDAAKIEGGKVLNSLPKDTSNRHPRAMATFSRGAFEGARGKHGWVWLEYPPESKMYRDPRTLWLTRMPGKTFNKHGRDVLQLPWLQPVDTMCNSIRARVRACQRSESRAIGVGFSERYVLPRVAYNEVLIYLAGRNYSLRRDYKKQMHIPAHAMGLMTDRDAYLDYREIGDLRHKLVKLRNLLAEPEKIKRRRAGLIGRIKKMETNTIQRIEEHRHPSRIRRLDYMAAAWDFNQSVAEAERLSGWLQR